MTSPIFWFNQGPMRGCYERGSIITTDNGSEWEIIERLKQDDLQTEGKSIVGPSHAALKLHCMKANVDPSEKSACDASARVYVQVPYFGTEFDDAQTRAAQADSAFQPAELEAYRILSDDPVVSKFTPKFLGSKVSVQEPSGFVPGGFLILVVWEKVPGIPLGDKSGKATGYWDQPTRERKKIREAFKKTFNEISSTVGIWPKPSSPSNLVWNFVTETLFWGFRKPTRKKGLPWRETWLPAFDLVKTPPGCQWEGRDWDGDTTGWKG
ncbi:hypothetical protein N7535_007186 [Penicillium sp. DV-2018c]|nr:hypothetical protein N7461_003210 [Penicillium sp. DV-2018c]KAJ5565548.1 hypothetical protein N7535_007186 [Penicillium sp. DV-2018c]